MNNLLCAAEKELSSCSASAVRITAVHVQAGVLANIMPDAFQFAYETLSQGTCFSGAELKYEEIPFEAECRGCGKVFAAMDWRTHCPQCGGKNYSILSGFDVYLTGIDFEEL